MSLADAFAPAEAAHRARVMQETWGHLYPELGHKYDGRIRFVVGDYGDCILLGMDFGSLDDSPLLYATARDVFDWVRGPGVWEWQGKLVAYKNGKTRLSRGKIVKLLEAL